MLFFVFYLFHLCPSVSSCPLTLQVSNLLWRKTASLTSRGTREPKKTWSLLGWTEGKAFCLMSSMCASAMETNRERWKINWPFVHSKSTAIGETAFPSSTLSTSLTTGTANKAPPAVSYTPGKYINARWILLFCRCYFWQAKHVRQHLLHPVYL